MKETHLLKKLIPLFAVIPFILGAVGYAAAGETFFNALYASFALYFINPVSDEYNVLIEIARWLAPLVTTAAILGAMRRIWTAIMQTLLCLEKDSVAVYSDKEADIVFDRRHRGAIYAGRSLRPLAKSHIIMLDSDTDSLRFYDQNKERLKNKRVFIALREMNFGLMKESDESSNVSFYDINSAAALTLWQETALWKTDRLEYNITIIGTGNLGQSVLNHGLLLNIYSLDQKITYSFIGTDSHYRAVHKDLNTCNSDTVHYFSPEDEQAVSAIENSDILIICASVSIEDLQTLAVMCRGSVYCYAPEDGGAEEYLYLPGAEPNFANTAETSGAGNDEKRVIHAFGKNSVVYTDANIRRHELISDAMDIHYDYIRSHAKSGEPIGSKEEEWEKLDGFLKWSNISTANFRPVLLHLIGQREMNEDDIEYLAQLEYIRWCRFHFLNFWTFKPNSPKDKFNRTHPCLCGFYEQPEELQNNNRDIIRALMELI